MCVCVCTGRHVRLRMCTGQDLSAHKVGCGDILPSSRPTGMSVRCVEAWDVFCVYWGVCVPHVCVPVVRSGVRGLIFWASDLTGLDSSLRGRVTAWPLAVGSRTPATLRGPESKGVSQTGGQGGANPLGRLGGHLAPIPFREQLDGGGGQGIQTQRDGDRDTERHTEQLPQLCLRPLEKRAIQKSRNKYCPPHGCPHHPRAQGVDGGVASWRVRKAAAESSGWGGLSLGPMSSPSQGGTPGSLQAPDLVPQQSPGKARDSDAGRRASLLCWGLGQQTGQFQLLFPGEEESSCRRPYIQERPSIPQPVFVYLLFFSDF